MRVCLGGTFDILHIGHEALLAKAFALGDEEVIIGITSDRMARRTRKVVSSLAVRRRNLEAYLRNKRWLRRARIAVLEDIAGPAALEGDIDPTAHAIDRLVVRKPRGRQVRLGHRQVVMQFRAPPDEPFGVGHPRLHAERAVVGFDPLARVRAAVTLGAQGVEAGDLQVGDVGDVNEDVVGEPAVGAKDAGARRGFL